MKAETRPGLAKRLSFLDRYLALWIFAAMGAGVAVALWLRPSGADTEAASFSESPRLHG